MSEYIVNFPNNKVDDFVLYAAVIVPFLHLTNLGMGGVTRTVVKSSCVIIANGEKEGKNENTLHSNAL